MKSCIQLFLVLVGMVLISQAAAADKVVVIPLSTAKKLKNVVTVSTKGGDFTNPVDAVNSITDMSQTNPYLIVIGPGRYNISTPLVMKTFVSIVGAGEDATFLYGNISSNSFNASSAIINGAGRALLSNLSVENLGGGGGTYSTAIYNGYQANLTIQDVKVRVSNNDYLCGIQNETGCCAPPTMLNVTIAFYNYTTGGYGIRNIESSTKMTNVTLHSPSPVGTNGIGLYNENGASPRMNNVDIRASGTVNGYGIMNIGSRPVLNNSYVSGHGGTNGFGIYNNLGGQIRIAYSTISGSTYGVFASFTGGSTGADWSTIVKPVFGPAACFGSKQQNGSALDSNCQ